MTKFAKSHSSKTSGLDASLGNIRGSTNYNKIASQRIERSLKMLSEVAPAVNSGSRKRKVETPEESKEDIKRFYENRRNEIRASFESRVTYHTVTSDIVYSRTSTRG